MKKITLGILIGLMLAITWWRVSIVLDIELVQFEDGSGKISWCLPNHLCE